MKNERYSSGLKNLHLLIQQASTRYANEFVWQDVKLTDEFKNAYAEVLQSNAYDIEFFDCSAVITTSQGRYIFVPNQWFVIASYPLDVYMELMYYKEQIKGIADFLGKQLTPYVKQLRDQPTSADKSSFFEATEFVLREKIAPEKIPDAKNRLWRFVSDYSWWSGQKTIDRTDFYMSVVLNMLNLVNASQGYVADIINVYANDLHLRMLVDKVDKFTVDLACNILREENDNILREEVATYTVKKEEPSDFSGEQSGEDIKKPARIKISANNNREIRFK